MKLWDWFLSLFKRKPDLRIVQPDEQAPPVEKSRKPSWKVQMEKWKGFKETMDALVRWLEPYWAKVGLKGYKGLSGTARAWCGLIVTAVLIMSGQAYIKNGAGAKNHAKYGAEIKWKVDGIPEGAIVHLDHDCDCKGDSNHVGLAEGDCAPEDLLKNGAKIAILGGNQNNEVNVTNYPVCEICAVRWPPKPSDPEGLKNWIPPRKITTSVNCSSGSKTGGSTR